MTEPEHIPPSPESEPAASPESRPDPRRGPDRTSVLLGNATLLGLGYLLLGLRRLALAACVTALALVALAALFPHVTAWRVLLGLVWAGAVLHAWRLTSPGVRDRSPAPAPQEEPPRENGADRHDGTGRPPWRTRLLTAACVLLVAFAWLRLDTWAVLRDAEAAHTGGDCERALASLRWLVPAHRLAHGSAAERGAAQERACERLSVALDTPDRSDAARMLDEYQAMPGALWDGAGPERADLLLAGVIAGAKEQEGTHEALEAHSPSLDTVEEAFAQLSETLESSPGQSGRAGAVAESFLAALDDIPPCRAREIDEWLLAQEWEDPALVRAMEPQAGRAPVRLFHCADDLGWLASSEEEAAARRDFLAAHPEHPLAERSAEGLLATGEYCAHPAAFPAAPAYEGEGPHAMHLTGLDPEEHDFPGSWRADGVRDTVLVVCVEGPEKGGYQRTCTYEPGADQLTLPFEDVASVDFYASAFTVQAFELRSGEPVEEYTAEIGDPCPAELEYDYYYFDSVPGEYNSDYTAADLRGIFDRLMD